MIPFISPSLPLRSAIPLPPCLGTKYLRQMDFGGDQCGILHPHCPFIPIPLQELLSQRSLETRGPVSLLGMIEPVAPEFIRRKFYSNYFLVPQRGGGWRLILNLRNLNLLSQHFRMVDARHYNPVPRFRRLVGHHQPLCRLLLCSYPPIPQTVPTLQFRLKRFTSSKSFLSGSSQRLWSLQSFQQCGPSTSVGHRNPHLDAWLLRG